MRNKQFNMLWPERRQRVLVMGALAMCGVVIGVTLVRLLGPWAIEHLVDPGQYRVVYHPVVLTVKIHSSEPNPSLKDIVLLHYLEEGAADSEQVLSTTAGSLQKQIMMFGVQNQVERILIYGGYHIEVRDHDSGERITFLSIADALGVERERVGLTPHSITVDIDVPYVEHVE